MRLSPDLSPSPAFSDRDGEVGGRNRRKSLLAICGRHWVGLHRASTRAMPKSDLPALPSLPAITLSIDRDRSEHAPRRAFLTIRRLELRARFPDGSVSEPFFYDIVERKALDAVVVAPHF